MGRTLVAAIDQGTTSSRCIVFDDAGAIVALAQREHRQIYPRPGWVEHDAEEIWTNVQAVIREALQKLGVEASALAAIGITNQRETTVLWDRATGEPVHNAIVWQDTRTDRLAAELTAAHGELFQSRSGLPPATYFAGPKIRWILDQEPALRVRAERGELMAGTMDAWLIWKLTGRHATDVTNASRSMAMSLATLAWDDELLGALDIPRILMPEICSSSEVYGTAKDFGGVPVASALGDQQAALFGQTCFEVGEGKCTYGTGAFLLVNTGAEPVTSEAGLLTTVAYKIGDAPAAYALEGSIAVAGSLVQWLRDNLRMIDAAPEIEALAREVEDNGGCYLVPAFAGLFAPYWRSDARGVICGLTGYVTRAHIARAALEAVAWQVREVVDAMALDSGEALTTLKADGGMTANSLLMQIQADLLGCPVVRPKVPETTCLGAAYAAGLAVGVWPDLATLKAQWAKDAEWTPAMDTGRRDAEHAKWKAAVERTLNWA